MLFTKIIDTSEAVTRRLAEHQQRFVLELAAYHAVVGKLGHPEGEEEDEVRVIEFARTRKRKLALQQYVRLHISTGPFPYHPSTASRRPATTRRPPPPPSPRGVASPSSPAAAPGSRPAPHALPPPPPAPPRRPHPAT